MTSLVLRRGGPGAVGWLARLLARMDAMQRQALIRHWTVIETRGFDAIEPEDARSLRLILAHLEQLASGVRFDPDHVVRLPSRG